MSDAVSDTIKDYIMREFLPGEDPGELTATTPLITGGILDSIAALKLVMFLEEECGVTFEAHEVNRDNLDTIASIAQLLIKKKPALAQ
jgi:acyl carrier protein